MRVLILSLDTKVLERDSAVQRRLILLTQAAGELTVFVPTERDSMEKVSEHLTVHSVGGWKPFQLLKLWSAVSKELATKKYDLITVQDAYFLGVLGVKLSEKFHIPLEVQVHGLERFTGFRKRIAESVLQKANRIRVVGNRLKQELTTNYPAQLRQNETQSGRQLPTTKLYTLPVYTQVEPPARQQKRKTVAYPFTFLTVGRLVPVKNIAMQIRVLAELSKKIPHVRLQIIGDGPLLKSLKLQVESLKLEDKVYFEGEQKNAGKFYEGADAFLLTSDSEGWGRVVLEAAAYKLPILMTDVGLAREVIRNEENGLIIPVGDERELLLAMQELVDRPELRERLGEAAFRTFRALPGQDEHIKKQIEEWQALISRK